VGIVVIVVAIGHHQIDYVESICNSGDIVFLPKGDDG
jgi:hypothetical protein